ncbi:MAG TPA: hypothetical protein VJA27_00170 [Patescibacteria group bacterium]|nr:hypothetical protein [Patescibacteria group bacterium]
MQKFVLPLLLVGVLVVVLVMVFLKKDSPLQIADGEWHNKFFGEVGVTVSRTVVVRGTITAPFDSKELYKPTKMTVKNKEAAFQSGSVSPSGAFEGKISESAWYGTLVPGEEFSATITFEKTGAQPVTRTGMFKKGADDKAELR